MDQLNHDTNNSPPFLRKTNHSHPKHGKSVSGEKPTYRSFVMNRGADEKGMPSSSGIGGLSMPGLSASQSFPLPGFVSGPTGHMAHPHKKPVFRDLPFIPQGLGEVEPNMQNLVEEVKVTILDLPPFYEKSTSFTCARSGEEIFRILGDALAPFNAVPKHDEGRYKGTARVLGHCVAFQVHVFKKSEGDHVVEFQRRRGDPCAFWHFFASTVEALGKDLADAAAFSRSLPGRAQRKHLEPPSLGKSAVSEKTIDSLRKMATNSVCCGSKLDALQTLSLLLDSDNNSSAFDQIGKLALDACSSKDELISHCGKSILNSMNLSAMKDQPESPVKLGNDEVIGMFAKHSISSLEKDLLSY
eukprot:jgi/Bigna1/88674/estExt_fgenesh1_pg.C_360044